MLRQSPFENAVGSFTSSSTHSSRNPEVDRSGRGRHSRPPVRGGQATGKGADPASEPYGPPRIVGENQPVDPELD